MAAKKKAVKKAAMNTASTTALTVKIPAPNIQYAKFTIEGTAPLVQLRFSAKAELMEKHAAGQQSRSKKTRVAKDFDALFEKAQHRLPDGSNAIPAASFRAAMISACRLVGFKMTLAKLSVFIIADGVGEDGMPLIKLHGKPEPHDAHVRNATGVVDIRRRAMFRKWHANLNLQYDGDQFSAQDIANLLLRAGMQVGIGEGRPDSKNSAGMGWGTFTLRE